MPEATSDPLTLAVAAELRAYRAAAELTIEELAAKAGIGVRTLKRVLKAERDIDVRTIELLVAAMDVDPQELFARATSRASQTRRTIA